MCQEHTILKSKLQLIKTKECMCLPVLDILSEENRMPCFIMCDIIVVTSNTYKRASMNNNLHA